MTDSIPARTAGDSSDESTWHSRSADEVLETLEARRAGLTSREADERSRTYGPNVLSEWQAPGLVQVALRQFKSMVIIILVIAGILAVAMQQWPESIAIAAVILINAAIGFVSEWRALRSMQALRQLSEHETRVRRDGHERAVPAHEVVPGDIIILQAEALVPADLRVLLAEGAQVNESALTGESVPTGKQAEPAVAHAPLAERVSMLYKGTTLVGGYAEGVAVATGMATEVGRVAELAQAAEEVETPLQQKLDRLGRRMAVLVLITAALIAGVGLLGGRAPGLMLETSIALGVAAIPEGLPIVATIALAAGMWLMAQHNAVVNRLPAVETLGATRVIFTDKTGTLTENRMTVDVVATHAGKLSLEQDGLKSSGDSKGALARRLLRVGVLCNGAELDTEDDNAPGGRGDPLEIALLDAGIRSDMPRGRMLREAPEVRRVAFERDTMMMATVHDEDPDFYVAVKGAPQAVLDACDCVAVGVAEAEPFDDSRREEWLGRARALAAEGLRLLAFAEKATVNKDAQPYRDLYFLGLVALHDPPREEVRNAINACQAAGIRVVMVTGDKPETAQAIAESVGIVGDPEDEIANVLHGSDLKSLDELDEADEERIHRANIFARVTPEQKLNLVQAYQDVGETVAMTGDGINDAPALKKADIGVAMGRRGTEAAKQVADMVLRDDALETIVAAVEQGRVIFSNIRKAVMFMLCTNGAEVLAIAVASLLNIPLPLRPLQILFLNVLTDVLPALALAVGKGEPHIMQRPPRKPDEPVLTRRHWRMVAAWSAVIATCVLVALFSARHWLALDERSAVTVSFLTLALTKLWFVFNLRSPRTSMLVNGVTQNPWVWAAIAACAVLITLAVYLPGLSALLETTPPGAAGWLLALGLSLVPAVLGQLWLYFRER